MVVASVSSNCHGKKSTISDQSNSCRRSKNVIDELINFHLFVCLKLECVLCTWFSILRFQPLGGTVTPLLWNGKWLKNVMIEGIKRNLNFAKLNFQWMRFRPLEGTAVTVETFVGIIGHWRRWLLKRWFWNLIEEMVKIPASLATASIKWRGRRHGHPADFACSWRHFS